MIKRIKKFFREALIKFNINIYHFTSKRNFEFIDLFKIKIPENIKLIRMGSDGDGGYLYQTYLKK